MGSKIRVVSWNWGVGVGVVLVLADAGKRAKAAEERGGKGRIGREI